MSFNVERGCTDLSDEDIEASVEDSGKAEVKAISGQCNSGTSQMTHNDVKVTFKILIKTNR